jgi:hypothetical protein
MWPTRRRGLRSPMICHSSRGCPPRAPAGKLAGCSFRATRKRQAGIDLDVARVTGRTFHRRMDGPWHFVLDNPGSVLDGSEGGNFLLAPDGKVNRRRGSNASYAGTQFIAPSPAPDSMVLTICRHRKTQHGYTPLRVPPPARSRFRARHPMARGVQG